MKKALVSILSLSLVLALIACGNTQAEPQPAEPEPPEVETITPEPPAEPEPEPPEIAAPEPVSDTIPAAPVEDDDTQDQEDPSEPEPAAVEPVSVPVKTETPKQTQQTEPKKTATTAPTETAPAETEQQATEKTAQQIAEEESGMSLEGWVQLPNGTWFFGELPAVGTSDVTPPKEGPKTSDTPMTAEQAEEWSKAADRLADKGLAGLEYDEEGGFYFYS